MTDERDREAQAEIVDLPRGRGGRGVAIAEPDPASAGSDAPPLGGRLALPASRRPTLARAGDGRQIVCEGLVRIYKVADLEVVALQGLDLVVGVGEMIAIVGASGSGKSTLLNILGGLDAPSAGRAVVAGHDLGQMGRRERTRYRRRVVGMIWQQTARNLLPYLTAQENVELPLLYRGMARRERHAAAREALARVGLAGWETHTPAELSGGQQQRVAIARAIVTQPAVLLADEPTGSLDFATGEKVMELMFDLNREHGTTLVLVTHDRAIASRCERRITIEAGRIAHQDSGAAVR